MCHRRVLGVGEGEDGESAVQASVRPGAERQHLEGHVGESAGGGKGLELPACDPRSADLAADGSLIENDVDVRRGLAAG